jgi:hypothetical protein
MARLAEAAEATIAGDEVDEIAMLAAGGIGPMAGSAGSGLRPREPDIEAASGRDASLGWGERYGSSR